jgi:hypothetical protein
VSNTTTEIGKALAGAFADIDHATKNASNPHFKSTYANLAEVLDVVRATFKKHGLAIVQFPGPIKKDADLTTVAITTTIVHTSGEMMGTTMEMPVNADKNGRITPHAVGSAITFGRRYALASAAGITQEDDDGNAGSDGGEDDEDTDIDSLRDDITAATTSASLKALSGVVSETNDEMLMQYLKARYKKLKEEEGK